MVDTPAPVSPPARARNQDDARLFSGTPDGEQRAAQFTESIPIVRGDDAYEPADAGDLP